MQQRGQQQRHEQRETAPDTRSAAPQKETKDIIHPTRRVYRETPRGYIDDKRDKSASLSLFGNATTALPSELNMVNFPT